jgi:hypothetical protein
MNGATGTLRSVPSQNLPSLRRSGVYPFVFSASTTGTPLPFGDAECPQRLGADLPAFPVWCCSPRSTRALDEPGWLRLGPQHAKLWRRGETRRTTVSPERREVIDDTAFSQIMSNLLVIGAPVEEGGFGDEQAMRIVMLVARTGRRVSEIRMLDRQPLLPLDRLTAPADGTVQAMSGSIGTLSPQPAADL